MRARWLAFLPLAALACNGLLALNESFLAPPGDAGSGSDAADVGAADADASTVDATDATSAVDATDAAEAASVCARLDPNAADFFVDRAAPDGGTGSSAGCPFKTITEALRAAKASSAATRTVHIAVGTYDAALGETFPFELRGVSLRGAGAGRTILDGAGTYDHVALGGTYAEVLSATLIVGDPTAITEIANLTLQTTQADTSGIFCDRGNATVASQPAATPNTRLSGLTIGPGYVYAFAGITTNTATMQSGCDAQIVGTTTRGVQTGVFLAGCGRGDKSLVPVAAEIGDNTDAGVTVIGANGYAVTTFDCVTALTIRRSTLAGKLRGGFFIAHPISDYWPPHFRIMNSTIRDATESGLHLDLSMAIERLEGNTFTGISAPNGSLAAPAIRFSGLAGAPYPRVASARSNFFFDNDIALQFSGPPGVTIDPAYTSDFGRFTDAGLNVFSCNSVPTGFSGSGGDVFFQDNGAGVTFPFVGNYWDHDPPTRRSTLQNGIDIFLGAATPPSLDITANRLAGSTCPANRVPGP